MTIIEIKISELRKAPYNPRIMPEHEMDALKKSVEIFGLAEPLVVNQHECDVCGDRKNVLIGGHQRLDAMTALGKADTLPAVVVDLHAAQEKQLNIALNKIGGHFDTPKLKRLLRGIEKDAPEMDLTTTGFTKGELANLLEPVELPEASAFARVSEDDEPEFTQMSFVLSKNQKARVLEALAKVREKGEVMNAVDPDEHIGYALLKMAQEYLIA